MFRELFGFELYQPFLVISVLANVALLLFLLHSRGACIVRPRLLTYIGIIGLGGFLGAKLLSIVFHGGIRSSHIELAGGLRYPGALIGVLTIGFAFRKVLPSGLSFRCFADLWAPSFVLACAIGRLGCLATGCCYGGVCHLPWAIRYPRGSAPWYMHFQAGSIEHSDSFSLAVHPFPLYLFLMEMTLVGFLLWMIPRRRYDGQVLLAFLAIHGSFKFVLEFFRDPYHPFHQIVLPISLVAGLILFRNRGPSIDRGRALAPVHPMQAP